MIYGTDLRVAHRTAASGCATRRIAAPAVALASVFVLTAALPSGAGAAQQVGAFAGSGCLAPTATVGLPTATSDRTLPTGYVPSGSGAAGRASLAATVMTCVRGEVDGRPLAHPFSLASSALSVAPRPAGAGRQSYAVDAVSDDPDVAALLARAGLPSRRTDAALLAVQSTGLGIGDGAGYRVRVNPLIGEASQLTRATVWHEGARGTTRLELVYTPRAAFTGNGSVEFPAGSASARALGATTATGTGKLDLYDVRATLHADRPAPATTAPATGATGTPRVRVSPACLRVDRARTLRVRVTRGGAAVDGARVAFGARSARTRSGVARLRVRAGSPGRRAVRVRLQDGARRTVAVRVTRGPARCGSSVSR